VTAPCTGAYGGVDNLEIMEEAANYNRFLLSLVTARVRPGDALLDFGAGGGILARPLAAAGYHIRCVEPDDCLRARLEAIGLAAHATLAEIPENSIDLIYTVNVLEHIADDAAAVAALRARLRLGGLLIVYVPAFPLLYSSMDRKVGHVRRYRRAGLAALLRQAGLAVEQVYHQDTLGFAAALLFKLFGNARGTLDRRSLVLYDRYGFPISRRLDWCASRWFGKNLFAVARRDD
jgi:SAM-dependent methyltransferase